MEFKTRSYSNQTTSTLTSLSMLKFTYTFPEYVQFLNPGNQFASSSISQTVIYLFHYERLILEITLNYLAFDKFFKRENLEHECPSKRSLYPKNPRKLTSGFESDGNLEAVLFKYDACPMNRALVSL